MANDATEKVRTVRPDSKGRISLGSRAAQFSGFLVKERKDGSFLLEPLVEIPAKEAWLFKNKKALDSVVKGTDQAAQGKTKKLGSFSKYLEEDDE